MSTGLHKADQDTRKFIRKHVMLGKNTGKGSGKHRNNKGKRRRLPPELIPLAIAPQPDEGIHTFPNTLPSDCPPSIPQRVGTDVSLVQFADVVEPSTASLVLRCKYCLSIRRKTLLFIPWRAQRIVINSSLGRCQTNTISFGVMYYVRQTRRTTMD